MKRTPLKRKAPMERHLQPAKASVQPVPDYDRQAWGKRKGWNRDRLAPVAFKAKTSARTQRCARCGEEAGGRKASGWHHWVAQEHLRAHVASLRLGDGEKRKLLRGLLRDERNLTPYCQPCHMAGEHEQARRFTRSEIPATAWEFAAELGEWAVIRLESYSA